MNDVQVNAEMLSDEEVAALNKARTILEGLVDRCTRAAWKAGNDPSSSAPTSSDYGRVHAMAEAADSAIFTALNWANSYNVRALTQEQLHNRPVAAEAAVA